MRENSSADRRSSSSTGTNGKCSLIRICLLLLFTSICPVPATCHAYTLTDSDDRSITFDQPFKRIISLYAAHTENLHALGLTDEIIAVSKSGTLYPDLPRLSFRDDPERFLALRPDLVLIRPMLSRACPRIVDCLEKNGVTVVSLQPVSITGMLRYWQDIAALTGREARAREIITAFRQEVERIRTKAGTIPEAKRKKVYFESIHAKMKTFAPSSIAIFALETAGGINIASDAKRVRNTNIAWYGKERILSKAGEIDLYLAQYGRMNPVTIDDIINEPGFQAIKAVRQGHIFLIREAFVSRPVPGLVKGIREIHDLLYGHAGHIGKPHGP